MLFFSFNRLNEIVNDNSEFDKTIIFEQRKTFYSLFINLVKILDLEEPHLQKINNELIDKIYQLPDENFVAFLQRLSMNELVDEADNPLLQFNQDGFRSVFFKLLLEITESLPILEEGSVKYSLTGHKEKFVLTTINEDEINAVNVVHNILQNMKSQNLLWDNHELINREINKKLIDIIPNIKNVPTGIVDEGNKFMSFAKENGLIDRETAKTILNHE
jgi:ABC-3C protein